MNTNQLITVVPGEYGTSLVHNDRSVDLTQEERDRARQADRIPLSKLRPQFPCTDVEFQALINREDFKRTIVTRTVERGSIHGPFLPVFSRVRVNEWLQQQQAFVAKLPSVVK